MVDNVPTTIKNKTRVERLENFQSLIQRNSKAITTHISGFENL